MVEIFGASRNIRRMHERRKRPAGWRTLRVGELELWWTVGEPRVTAPLPSDPGRRSPRRSRSPSSSSARSERQEVSLHRPRSSRALRPRCGIPRCPDHRGLTRGSAPSRRAGGAAGCMAHRHWHLEHRDRFWPQEPLPKDLAFHPEHLDTSTWCGPSRRCPTVSTTRAGRARRRGRARAWHSSTDRPVGSSFAGENATLRRWNGVSWLGVVAPQSASDRTVVARSPSSPAPARATCGRDLERRGVPLRRYDLDANSARLSVGLSTMRAHFRSDVRGRPQRRDLPPRAVPQGRSGPVQRSCSTRDGLPVGTRGVSTEVEAAAGTGLGEGEHDEALAALPRRTGSSSGGTPQPAVATASVLSCADQS